VCIAQSYKNHRTKIQHKGNDFCNNLRCHKKPLFKIFLPLYKKSALSYNVGEEKIGWLPPSPFPSPWQNIFHNSFFFL
jgi:hypothetical protein